MNWNASFSGIIRRNRCHSTQSLVKVGTLTLVVFMIAMALMPLTAGSARAANDDDKSNNLLQPIQNVQLDPQGQDPDVTPDATEPPQLDLQVDPGQVQVDLMPIVKLPGDPPTEPGLVSIYINKIGCPQGFDAYSADYYGLAYNCHDTLNGILFELHNSSLDDVVAHTGDVQDHMAIWDPIHEGDQTLIEQVPGGYTGKPVVICNINDTGAFTTTPVGDAVGYDITVHLNAGDVLFCDWFDVPDPGQGSLYINKIGCPVGFDAYSADIYELSYNCHDTPNGVPFTVNTTSGPVSQNTGDVQDHAVDFENITAGDLTVTETLSDGYGQPIVFCKINDGSEEAQTVDPSSASINIHLDNGSFIWCDWFNVPENPNGSVTIWKFQCPEGTDPTSPDRNYFSTNCTSPMDGVKFTLADGVNPDLTGTTGDAGPGQIAWTNVPTGMIDITESIPDGYFDPVVYCKFSYTVGANGGVAIADGLIPVSVLTGGVLKHEFQPKESLSCWWYNIPTVPTPRSPSTSTPAPRATTSTRSARILKLIARI
ncbi:MAG: hypothetical protein ACJ789_16870 [Thermomicrobiales bacterium]